MKKEVKNILCKQSENNIADCDENLSVQMCSKLAANYLLLISNMILFKEIVMIEFS